MALEKLPKKTLCQRVALDVQLRAEEKWIMDALTKIRNQRNSLQIERLHLESLKAKLCKEDKKIQEVPNMPDSPESQAFSAVNLMKKCIPFDFEVPIVGLDEEMCNSEELQLGVTDFLFNHNDQQAFPMEEDEDDDEENSEDIVIDMNMFMNGNTK